MPYYVTPEMGDTAYFRLGETNTLDDVRQGTVVSVVSDEVTIAHNGLLYHVNYGSTNPSANCWRKFYHYAQLASDPDTPVATLIELMGFHFSEVDVELASNPNSPQEVLLHLAENLSSELTIPLAKNPSSDTLILEHVLGSRLASTGTYHELAARTDLPDYMYVQLMRTRVAYTILAQNKTVPVKLFVEELAKSLEDTARKQHLMGVLRTAKPEEYMAYVREALGDDASNLPENWQMKVLVGA